MTFEISRERIQSGMETMNSFGLRLTGSEGQQKFVDYLKDEILRTIKQMKIYI